LKRKDQNLCTKPVALDTELAEQLGLFHMMIARVWRKHSLKPHRLDSYMASEDPDFEEKAADIIDLYLHPSDALDRLDPVLPLSPGRAERHGFEYYRYVAFNNKTGEVLGNTAARHTLAEFLAFLTDIVVSQPRDCRQPLRRTRLHRSKTFSKRTVMFTCSSWLKQPLIFFSSHGRDRLRPQVGKSTFFDIQLAAGLRRWTMPRMCRKADPSVNVVGAVLIFERTLKH
jgi:hypothetical protein